RVETEILLPTIRALREDGRPYRGILYCGLMITSDGPRVIEYNCRLGDPETQVLLPLMASSLLEPMRAVALGSPLAELEPVRWKSAAAVTTVLASGGYPDQYEKGFPIDLPPDLEQDDVLVFHAGTDIKEGQLVTAGGRVLAVTGLGDDVAAAAAKSRAAAERIRYSGRTFRRDIGWREIAR